MTQTCGSDLHCRDHCVLRGLSQDTSNWHYLPLWININLHEDWQNNKRCHQQKSQVKLADDTTVVGLILKWVSLQRGCMWILKMVHLRTFEFSFMERHFLFCRYNLRICNSKHILLPPQRHTEAATEANESYLQESALHELYPIIRAAILCGHKLSRKSISIHSDKWQSQKSSTEVELILHSLSCSPCADSY